MDQTVWTIIFGAFGVLGVLFGIYKHFATLKVAELVFDIKEISQFSLPLEFYKDIPSMPLLVDIENKGNKAATNLILTLDFKSKIVSKRVDTSENYEVENEDDKIVLKAQKLNPAEQIRVYVNCEKTNNPTKTILNGYNLTISEGNVLTKDSLIEKQKVIDTLYDALPFGLGTIPKAVIKVSEDSNKELKN